MRELNNCSTIAVLFFAECFCCASQKLRCLQRAIRRRTSKTPLLLPIAETVVELNPQPPVWQAITLNSWSE